MIRKDFTLTPEGKKQLEQEHAALVARRPAIAERLATARAFGDLSENQEYSDARSEQKTVENRIIEIEEILKSAKIIRSARHTKVVMGAHVTVELGRKQITYDIVGPVEADPLEGKISNESPIGKALFGRSVGEIAELKTPRGVNKYKIISIE